MSVINDPRRPYAIPHTPGAGDERLRFRQLDPENSIMEVLFVPDGRPIRKIFGGEWTL